MLDIKLLRENPEIVKNNLKKRRDEEKLKLIDIILEKDKKTRYLTVELEKLKQRKNQMSQEINQAKKQNKDIAPLLQEMKQLPEKIIQVEQQTAQLKEELLSNLQRLPNIMHESVPYGKDDTENIVVKTRGKIKKQKFEIKSHAELAEQLDIADFTNAGKTTGKGFYFLKGDLALLNQALIRFAIDFLIKKGYPYIEPPYMIRKAVCDGVTDYEFFKNMIYKIENEDLYLIGTSEHPIVGLFMNTTIPKEKLPLKFVGYSACFRKEIGSHGVDEKGLFRVHQFHKVEQVIFCEPEQSWKLHEELLGNSEALFKALELPYQVVNVCTGDLGIVAAKKYDLEVYMPRQQKYREACSCSNCTDYQARRMDIKFGVPGAAGNKFVHTLNNTAIATSRALVAILENYQNKDGSITVPKALVKYMNGKKKIGSNV